MLKLEPLDLSGIGQPRNGLGAIESTGLKFFPADYNGQGPVASALALRDRLRPEQIERVNISLHWGGWHAIGGGAGDHDEKWAPATRETADHSLAYLVAVALLDGAITLQSFGEERLRDPAVRTLMQRIVVAEDPELTRAHAGELPGWPSVVEIILKNGKSLRQASAHPKGHPLDPLSDAELEEKFWAMSDRLLPRAQGQRLLDTLWSIERLTDITELTDQFRTFSVD